MHIEPGSFNWLAILICVVVGQVLLTVWFTAVFGKPWATEYGAADAKQHTKEIPGYTYAIGTLCTLLLVIGIAGLQMALGVDGVEKGVMLAIYVVVHLSLSTALPGYAFLQRYRAFGLAMGAQTLLIFVVSIILAVWRA